MREIEVIEVGNGFIGETEIVGGDVRQYRVRFEDILCGAVLTGVTATVTSSVSTVTGVELWDDHKSVTFFITANTSYEIFTLALNTTDTLGQTLNWTLIVRVNAPVTENVTNNPLPLIIGPTGPTGPANGINATIVTAPLGPTGTTGSMTFVNGVLTAQTQAR